MTTTAVRTPDPNPDDGPSWYEQADRATGSTSATWIWTSTPPATSGCSACWLSRICGCVNNPAWQITS